MSDTFRTSFRGYDPADVDPVLRTLRADAADATARVGSAQVEISKLGSANDELVRHGDELRARIVELEAEVAQRPAPTFVDLGEKVGAILTLAQEEASDLRESSAKAAATLLENTSAEAELTRSDADSYAVEARSRADADAAVTVERARREVDDMLDFADRESQARREEGEALYERQRAEATTAAADFERTLAERREDVAAAFSSQMQEHERMLAEAVARRDEAEVEAQRLLDEALRQSRALVASAEDESAQILTAARGNADRIQTESARELAAATARRDSISSQLANVRQMLGTLGGGVALPGGSAPAQVEATLSRHDVETVDSELLDDEDGDVEDAEFVEVQG